MRNYRLKKYIKKSLQENRELEKILRDLYKSITEKSVELKNLLREYDAKEKKIDQREKILAEKERKIRIKEYTQKDIQARSTAAYLEKVAELKKVAKEYEKDDNFFEP